MSTEGRKPGGEAVPFGSLELYEQATQEIYRREYGDLVQIRAGQREFLSVRLGREHYAVDLHGILEVTRPSAITPVPFSPSWVLGVMLLRGNIVPIFAVGRMLGLGHEDFGVEPGERVLMVSRKGVRGGESPQGPESKDSVVGLLVDEVLEVVAVPEEDLGPVPATVTGPRAEFVIGVARKAEKVLGILNHGRLAKADPGDKALEGA